MSFLVRLLRRWGFVRLADHGLVLTPAGELALASDPFRPLVPSGLRDLGPAAMLPMPRLSAAGLAPPAPAAAGLAPPAPAAEDEDWDQVVARAKARAELEAPPAVQPGAAEDEADEDDWAAMLAAAKARAAAAPPECAEEDSVTATQITPAPEHDATRVDLSPACPAADDDDEITAIAPRRPLTQTQRNEIAHEPTLTAVPLDAAEEQRRRAAAREARRLAQRSARPTLTGMPVPRCDAPPQRRASGSRPSTRTASPSSPPPFRARTASSSPPPFRARTAGSTPPPARPHTAVGLPAQPSAPLPRLSARFGQGG